jgi:hypothetical protein
MVVHDDFVYANRFPHWSRPWAERKFGDAYRAARTRLCISDAMAATYERRFGAAGVVIHPTRSSVAVAASIASRVRHGAPPLTFMYGGSINSPRQFEQIRAFSAAVAAAGHRTVVYTPQHESLRGSAPGSSSIGDVLVERDGLQLHAPLSPAEFVRVAREEADCLVLPQPFDEAERATTSTSFPSKWVEYSAIGVPLIVWAPPWATSAQFAIDHTGCAEVVTTPDTTDLLHAIARLAASAAYRAELAEGLLAVGRQAFAPETAWRQFWTALQS